MVTARVTVGPVTVTSLGVRVKSLTEISMADASPEADAAEAIVWAIEGLADAVLEGEADAPDVTTGLAVVGVVVPTAGPQAASIRSRNGRTSRFMDTTFRAAGRVAEATRRWSVTAAEPHHWNLSAILVTMALASGSPIIAMCSAAV